VVAVAALYGREAEEDRGQPDDHVRQPDVGRLVGEAEQEGRQRQKRAGDHVDQVVHGHRRDLPDAELVVGDQAVGDQPEPEHDRDDRCRRVLRESKEPRRGDQRNANDVVERRVELRRDETHCSSFRDGLPD
jgi:hypothetical protein